MNVLRSFVVNEEEIETDEFCEKRDWKFDGESSHGVARKQNVSENVVNNGGCQAG